ncbi:lipid-A-disaccharide synthase N-terminal domain-containing protein [Zhouia sp. PK063]|uniref:lipid-A-disaccharide synthase N-terminal domain-containing protein n=1 Tax=Zhouia sp. PK063 TaxID=3373602 RepID=UPI0037A49E24
MSHWLIYVIGFIAQGLFSSRLILQWLLSEKHKKVLTPHLFWQLSLLASFLLFVYGYLRHDFAIMLGQTLTYFIYIRNIQIQGDWKKIPRWFRLFLWIFPVLIIIFYYNNQRQDIHLLFNNDNISTWLLIMGSLAQVIFTLRFFYQWIYSERKKESVLPLGFWVLSLIGAALILTYAIFRKDPVLGVGHLMGSVIYFRNIYIIKQKEIPQKV